MPDDIRLVRYEIGDTDKTEFTDDGPISDALELEGTVLSAAARCAEWLAAKYTKSVDKTVGPFSLSGSKRAEQFRKLAADLRVRDSLIALPYAGGISIASKDAREEDSDRVEPAFQVGMMDNPSSLSSTSG